MNIMEKMIEELTNRSNGKPMVNKLFKSMEEENISIDALTGEEVNNLLACVLVFSR